MSESSHSITYTKRDLGLLKHARWGGMTDEAKTSVVKMLLEVANGGSDITIDQQIKASNALLKIDRINQSEEHFRSAQVEVQLDNMTTEEIIEQLRAIDPGLLKLGESHDN